MFESLIVYCALSVGQAPQPQAPAVIQFEELPSSYTFRPVGHSEAQSSNGPGCTNCGSAPVMESTPCSNCGEEKADASCGCEEEKCGWCNLGDPLDISSMLLCEDSAWDFGGWTTLGYHSQTTGALATVPGTAGVMFNNQPDRLNLHQSVLYVAKEADGKDGFDWGFRASVLYGIDAIDTQAFGNRPGTWDFQNGWGSTDQDGTALPELYLEAAFSEKFKIKGGRFYTLIGYETVTAPDNFFYSHAFTFFFSEPFTHTGVLGTYTVSDKLELTGGYVLGNDSAFQVNQGGGAYLGIATWNPTDNLALSYALNVGDLGFSGNGFHHTALVDWTINDKWEYVLQNDVADTELIRSQAIVNYLYYTVNDCVKMGGRAEWYHVFEEDFYEITFGVNVTPQANIRFRPEVRYQWTPDGKGAKNPIGVTTDHGLIFGIDAVITY